MEASDKESEDWYTRAQPANSKKLPIAQDQIDTAYPDHATHSVQVNPPGANERVQACP